jgi:hypothetical protein
MSIFDVRRLLPQDNILGPLMTSWLISWKFTGVTGSGKVNFLAKTGGTPISFGSIFTSGEITDRAA